MMNKNVLSFRMAVMDGLLSAVIIGLFAPGCAQAVSYIRITVPKAQIHTQASVKPHLVAVAVQDDIFELIEQTADGYLIDVYSGEPRRIEKTDGEIINYAPDLPEDLNARAAIYKAIQDAEVRAKREADKKYPIPVDSEANTDATRDKNTRWMQIYVDKFLIDLAHEHGFQMPMVSLIMMDGFRADIEE